MITLSEIIALPRSQRQASYRQVVADEVHYLPPEGVKAIDFLLQQDGRGEIDDQLIDTIISFSLESLQAGIEIPVGAEAVSPHYFVSVAANTNFRLVLLAPDDMRDCAAWARHLERVHAFSLAYLAQANFATTLHPVTDLMRAVFVQIVTGQSDESFNAQDVARASGLKGPSQPLFTLFANVRAAAREAFGGKEGLEDVAAMMMGRIRRETIDLCEAVQANRNRMQGTAAVAAPA